VVIAAAGKDRARDHAGPPRQHLVELHVGWRADALVAPRLPGISRISNRRLARGDLAFVSVRRRVVGGGIPVQTNAAGRTRRRTGR